MTLENFSRLVLNYSPIFAEFQLFDPFLTDWLTSRFVVDVLLNHDQFSTGSLSLFDRFVIGFKLIIDHFSTYSLPIIESAEALPILCVSALGERGRERERLLPPRP